MLTAERLSHLLESNGIDFSTGVPCSILKGIINHFSSGQGIDYIPATREDEAIGIATGAYLAGRRPVVLMQNSGLGNSINALTSLAMLYKIPMLLLIGWRGYRGDDAPEHLIMGKITTRLLKDVGVSVEILSEKNATDVICASVKTMLAKETPVALVLRRGIAG